SRRSKSATCFGRGITGQADRAAIEGDATAAEAQDDAGLIAGAHVPVRRGAFGAGWQTERGDLNAAAAAGGPDLAALERRPLVLVPDGARAKGRSRALGGAEHRALRSAVAKVSAWRDARRVPAAAFSAREPEPPALEAGPRLRGARVTGTEDGSVAADVGDA